MGRGALRNPVIRIRSNEQEQTNRTTGRDLADEMAERGLVAVPMKPTMDQIIAATAAADVTVEQAWRVYTAMLAAA